MKRTDIAMIILIASVSVLVAYFVASGLFGSAGANGTTVVQTIDPISATIVEPEADIFNSNAINPTNEVRITGSQQPATTNGTQ